MSGPARPLGLGIAGAGGFAEFITAAVADLPSVRLSPASSHRRAARVRDGGRPIADVDSGWAAVATALAGTESLRTGTTVEITQINAS